MVAIGPARRNAVLVAPVALLSADARQPFPWVSSSANGGFRVAAAPRQVVAHAGGVDVIYGLKRSSAPDEQRRSRPAIIAVVEHRVSNAATAAASSAAAAAAVADADAAARRRHV